MLDLEKARECFTLSQNGDLVWKHRPVGHFKSARACNAWNARFPGKTADQADSRGYSQVKVQGVKHLSHKVVFLLTHGLWPEQVDHVNGDRRDNRPENLRQCNHSQNCGNQAVRKNNKLGIKGVSERRGRFVAAIVKNGQQTMRQGFATAEEAGRAYAQMAEEKFGEFSKV